MYTKILVLFVAVIGVNCRYLLDTRSPYYLEEGNIHEHDLEDVYYEQPYESARPVYLSRHVRQAHGLMNTNPDGSANVLAKFPLTGSDTNKLSAIGSLEGAKDGAFKAGSAGLALDNINGHSLSVSGRHIPGFGDQLTGAGKVNLLNNDHHKLDANAFATKTFPSNPAIPNFNTVGGGLDYMYNNKVGASLGMSNMDLLQKTDYSAMGKLNLFRDRTSSLDFSAGATKSVSPFLPSSSWQPSAGLSYTKFW